MDAGGYSWHLMHDTTTYAVGVMEGVDSERSAMMGRIRGKNTTPAMVVRRLLLLPNIAIVSMHWSCRRSRMSFFGSEERRSWCMAVSGIATRAAGDVLRRRPEAVIG